MKFRIVKYWVAIFCLHTVTSLVGQDNQYWNQQYGARSSLMGGAVIAGCTDNTAVFYNPARLAYLEEASISIHADLFKFQNISMPNGAGDGFSLKSKNYYTYPLAITGLIDFKNNNKWKAGYMFMMKQNAEFENSFDRDQEIDNLFSSDPGTYQYVGGFSRKSKLEELTAGFSIARKLGDHFSIGLTQLVSYRNQNYYFNSYGRAINDADYFLATNTETQDVSYSNFRTYSKVGLAFEKGHFRFGLATTLPSINIKGNGAVTREQLWTNDFNLFYSDGAPPVETYYKQEKLNTVYKSPLSVSAGIEFFTESTVIALAAEMFQPISQYRIISPPYRTLLYPTTGGYDGLSDSLNFMNIYAHNNQVVNYSIAIEQKLSSKWKLLTSFFTDMNYAKDDGFKNYSVTDPTISKIIINQSSWDIFHNTLGFSYSKKHSMITFGVDYQYGQGKNQSHWVNVSITDIKNDVNNGPGFGLNAAQKQTNTINYQSFNLILGFTHFLHREKETEKAKE